MNSDSKKSAAPIHAEQGRSSHWHRHFDHESWQSTEFGIRAGLGIFIPRKPTRVAVHYLFQLPYLLYGRHYKAFPASWRAGRRVAKIQHRVFDFDDLRQVLALSCVAQYVELSEQPRQTFAVIGDGYGRLSNLLLATVPGCQLVVVNLSGPLRIDMAAIHHVKPDARIVMADSDERIRHASSDADVIAIAAERSQLLRLLPIDGAFNISSMQEMELDVVARYFDLLRANPSARTWFYCSNAIEKRWADGTVVRFADYPWSQDDVVLLDEWCRWAHRGYNVFPPRYVERPFRIQHRLAFLSKNLDSTSIAAKPFAGSSGTSGT